MITCGRGIYSKINKGKEETVSHIIGNSKPIFIGKCLICFINQNASNQSYCSTYFLGRAEECKILLIHLLNV